VDKEDRRRARGNGTWGLPATRGFWRRAKVGVRGEASRGEVVWRDGEKGECGGVGNV